MLLAVITIVVCAPGYPGNTAEAQPAMDAFARAVSARLRQPVQAVYEETAKGGLTRLESADVLLSPLPFFLAHEKDRALTARLMAAPKDGPPVQPWTLVAAADHPAALTGYAVQSSAGYAPRFVHAMAPAVGQAQVIDSAQVLSGLRRAANGEKLAVLLDGAQARALPTLPFAAKLSTVSMSAAVPVAVVATVGKRLDAKRWKALQDALLAIGSDAAARDALEGIQMTGFVALDAAALGAATSAWQKAR